MTTGLTRPAGAAGPAGVAQPAGVAEPAGAAGPAGVAQPAPGDRTVWVEQCMGTVFTIDIRGPGQWGPAIDEVVNWLHQVDSVFSTYKEGSDVSRIRSGELTVARAHPDVVAVLALCERVERETDGYFTAFYDGSLDPTGLVKGWAIERASNLLRRRGSRNHAVNGGGDIQASGEAAPGRPWVVGISDPLDRTKLIATVSGRDFAVATSGTGERGAHLMNPRSGAPATALASVTVTGPSLTRVDALATAACAMGSTALAWIERLRGHEGLVVAADGHCSRTTLFHQVVGGAGGTGMRRQKPAWIYRPAFASPGSGRSGGRVQARGYGPWGGHI